MATTETLHITQILQELKLVGGKIEKTANNATPVLIVQGGKAPAGHTDLQAWDKEAVGDYDSIHGNFLRKRAMKAALVKANAENTVTVDGTKMTVADAIERKNSVNDERQVVKRFRMILAQSEQRVDALNQQMEQQITAHVQNMVGKDEATKLKEADYKEVDKFYRTRHEAVLRDPIGLKARLDKWEEEIDGFEKDVDAQLQISNASTKVKVTY